MATYVWEGRIRSGEIKKGTNRIFGGNFKQRVNLGFHWALSQKIGAEAVNRTYT